VKLDRAADFAARIEHHVPTQAGDLTRPQPGFDGQQNDNPVSVGIPGRANVRQKVPQMSI
jgi:hypothetical protein